MGLYEQFSGTFASKPQPILSYTNYNLHIRDKLFSTISNNVLDNSTVFASGTQNASNYIQILGNNKYRIVYSNSLVYLNIPTVFTTLLLLG